MTSDTKALDARHVWHPFTQASTAPPPVPIIEAKGAVLVAEDGREYLDLISSWWVNLHGHSRPEIAAAIADQAGRLEQVIFAGFTHAPAANLAARLAGILPGDLDRVFFSDDGSTAVEVALKIALQRGGGKRRRFIAFEGGYHGDTVGAMSAGASSGFFDVFKPLLFDVEFLPYPATWDGDGDVEAKEKAALEALDRALGDDVAALIMEPLVQGASGMRMCRPGFVAQVAEKVRDSGALLILDEIMTGFGRTGRLFACEIAGVTPDIICLSKGLTGGFLPLSVTVCREGIFREFLGPTFAQALVHGHSYTANPIACSAALASLELTLAPGLPVRWKEIETLHRQRMAGLGPRAVRRRVRGSIAAFDFDCSEAGYRSEIGIRLRNFFMDRGLALRPLGNVVYLLPPYCITDAQLHAAWDGVAEAVASME